MYPHPEFPAPQRIAVNGVVLEVFEAGRGAGRPAVVLCHGWPDLAYAWRDQIPALVAAGYHVIAPNQRGFGRSSCPEAVEAYDIVHLTGDMVGLLDHFGHERAHFVGHDWGANVVWSLALLHPGRVDRIVNLALPYQPRTPQPWVAFLEGLYGSDHYMVHFNRQPGVADRVLEANTARFLGNLLRRDVPPAPPGPGMMMIGLAEAAGAPGVPLLGDADLAAYVAAFEASGFTGGINWYRNLDRNWRLLAGVDPIVQAPALMIYGARDPIPPFPALAEFVPRVEVQTFDCGHWIQQERPAETTRAILDTLGRTQGASGVRVTPP